MPIYTYEGKILAVDGQIAISQDCCCDVGPTFMYNLIKCGDVLRLPGITWDIDTPYAGTWTEESEASVRYDFLDSNGCGTGTYDAGQYVGATATFTIPTGFDTDFDLYADFLGNRHPYNTETGYQMEGTVRFDSNSSIEFPEINYEDHDDKDTFDWCQFETMDEGVLLEIGPNLFVGSHDVDFSYSGGEGWNSGNSGGFLTDCWVQCSLYLAKSSSGIYVDNDLSTEFADNKIILYNGECYEIVSKLLETASAVTMSSYTVYDTCAACLA